jgi:hypothetical protein
MTPRPYGIAGLQPRNDAPGRLEAFTGFHINLILRAGIYPLNYGSLRTLAELPA